MTYLILVLIIFLVFIIFPNPFKNIYFPDEKK
jgi:hypothetical protein